MPLLNKKPFKRIEPPKNIEPEQEVFYLEATNEVFLNHTEYFNRVIELNATVWSCAYTRKTNLTFYEALDSEAESLNSLKHFPNHLEKPILFIVKNYTNRGRFEDLVNDIYFIMKDRYFISEEITYTEKSRRFQAKIVGSFVLFSSEDPIASTSETKIPLNELKEPSLPIAENYRYTLQILDGLPVGDDGFREAVTPERIFRCKEIGSRQKVKLFLKNACYMPWPGDHYIVKDEYLTDGIVSNLSWQLIMAGSEPVFPQTPVLQRGRTPNMLKSGFNENEKKEKAADELDAPQKPKRKSSKPFDEKTKTSKLSRSSNKSEEAQNSTVKRRKKKENDPMLEEQTPTKKAKTAGTPKMSEKKKKQIAEQQTELKFLFTEAVRLGIEVNGLQQEEKLLSEKVVTKFKQDVKEAKDKERELIKEERKKKMKEKLIWSKKREDLICDDLKPMPRFNRLELPAWITDEEFGDYLFLLQFFYSFKELLPLKEVRGTADVYFSDIVISIRCNDPQISPYADFMRVLLSIRTDVTDEEDGDEADIGNRDEVYLMNTQNCDPTNPIYGESIRDSCDIHNRIRKIHGKSVRHLPVDWMTLSEIIRLIFLTSGYYTGMATHRHRLYTRGNFKGNEDPGFEFRNEKRDIMEKLKTQTVFDLEPSERMEIMKTIILQLLTYSKFRNHIETQYNDECELKKEIKKLKNWDSSQEQESNMARLLLEQELEQDKEKKVEQPTAIGKRLKCHLKAINEGRRLDRTDLDSILLDSIPYSELDLDEIVTARLLQKKEYEVLMKDLITKIFETHASISSVHLGTDRAFRKYFIIDNMAAVFIENPTEFDRLGSCDEASNIKKVELLEENETNQVFVCSGDEKTCKVHGEERFKRPRWCYLNGKDQFEKLMESLNPRGFRENELLEELGEYKTSIIDILDITEQSLSNGEWYEMMMTNANDPADSYNIDWDTELRDLLLDFEEKINQGQMGSIGTTFSVDREKWRENLKKFGDVTMLMTENLKIGGEDVVNIEEAQSFSEVKRLSIAFLQIVRCISVKFIRAPFTSPLRDENAGGVKGSELFTRWQKGLIECDSYSALSLFLSTIESSIRWDKSRLQGKCRQCRRKGAATELVLCSECDNCYHLICVNLPNDQIAPNNWLCSSCKANQRKIANEARRKQRVTASVQQLAADEEEELKLGSMSYDDSDGSVNVKSSDTENSGTMTRTSSGRPVRRVQYTELIDGKPPLKQSKQRKSNGLTYIEKIERPTRSNAGINRMFDSYDENTSVDEDDSINNDDDEDERRRRSKRRTPKPRVSHETIRTTVQNSREKMVALENLLKESMRQECSWPFLEPVDRKEVPDYYEVIKRPMDLRSIINKLKQKVYNSPQQVREDFDLIINNCETYNEDGSEIHVLSQQLYNFVSDKMNQIINR